jgi:hypothetical protein
LHQPTRFHPHEPLPLNPPWNQNRHRRILFLPFPQSLLPQQMAFFLQDPN